MDYNALDDSFMSDVPYKKALSVLKERNGYTKIRSWPYSKDFEYKGVEFEIEPIKGMALFRLNV